MATEQPNTWVDTTDSMDRKIRALHSHASQMSDPAGIEQRVREWAAMNARAAGFPGGRAAEGFRAVDTR